MASEIIHNESARRHQHNIDADRSRRDGGSWVIYDEPYSSYRNEFLQQDDQGKIRQILDRVEDLPNPVVIDLLAPSTTLRSFKTDVRRDRPFKGISVGYADNRTDEIKALDASLGVEYLAGDLNKDQTWQKITGALGEKKADLIMERGYGPAKWIMDTGRYRKRMAAIWDMADPNGGAAILQIPDANALAHRGIPMQRWISHLEEAGINHFYHPTFDSGKLAGNNNFGLLMVQKTPDHLALPAMTPEDIRIGHAIGVDTRRQLDEAWEEFRFKQRDKANRGGQYPSRIVNIKGIVDRKYKS